MLDKAITYLRTTGPIALSTFDDAFYPDGFDLRVQLVANASAVQDDQTIRLADDFKLEQETAAEVPAVGVSPGVMACVEKITAAFQSALAESGYDYQPGDSVTLIAKGIDYELKITEMRDFITSVAAQSLPDEIPSWARDNADFGVAFAKTVKLARELRRVLPT